jgi:predicted P-loop ATPase
MDIATRKYQLIKAITDIDKEEWLEQLARFLQQIEERNSILQYAKPMREKTVIEEIAKEQGYKPNPEILESLGGAWADVEETLEEMLASLTP